MVGLSRAMAAETVGSAVLSAAVIGSGIMGWQLSGGNAALALLANSLATGAVLAVLLSVLGSISGAHFNPIVTLVMAAKGRLSPMAATLYALAQLVGVTLGVLLAHGMFDLPLFQRAAHMRSGGGQLLAEFVASFVLLMSIVVTDRLRPAALPGVVALVITSAYWFTSSTSFANPVLTLGRAFSDTFAGIRLIDVPPFAVAQLLGGCFGAGLGSWLIGTLPGRERGASDPQAIGGAIP